MSDVSQAPYDEAVVFGASGGIGAALVRSIARSPTYRRVHAISRRPLETQEDILPHHYEPNESGIAAVLDGLLLEKVGLVIVAIGTLHDESHGPEKSIQQFDSERFLDVMRVNAVLPTLIGKALMPLMKKRPLKFAALSARVGSISDNRLGGWHSYRASKAALNMLIRNIAVEAGRVNKETIAVALHPGTVDTALSAPFQANVPEGKLFEPDKAADCLIEVLSRLSPADSGKCFDYAGREILP